VAAAIPYPKIFYGKDLPLKPFSIPRWKKCLFALLPTFFVLGLSEFLLAVLGMGRPFQKDPHFGSGGGEMMQMDRHSGLRMKSRAVVSDREHLNSLGFRDDELKENADVYMLCLGDSTVFGWEVSDRRLVYPELLERKLTDLGHRIDVFNAGVPSYTVYQGLQSYLHRLKKLRKWDVVVATFGWNERPGQEMDIEYVINHPPLDAWKQRFFLWAKRFRIYNALRSFFDRHLQKGKTPEELADSLYIDHFRQLAYHAKSAGSTVILLPVLVRFEDRGTAMGRRMLCFNDAVKKLEDGKSVFYLPVDVEFDKRRNEIGWFDNFHFNARGHEIVAESLLQFLMKNKGL
jgi:lysophospholipase L1-like esterase